MCLCLHVVIAHNTFILYQIKNLSHCSKLNCHPQIQTYMLFTITFFGQNVTHTCAQYHNVDRDRVLGPPYMLREGPPTKIVKCGGSLAIFVKNLK